MKKIIFFSFSFLFLSFSTTSGQLRHIKGNSSVGLIYGETGNSYLLGVGYSHYFQPSWIWNVNILYETGAVASTKFKNYSVNGGIDYTFLKISDFLYLNAGLSAFSGFEHLTTNESSDETKNFTTGTIGNINMEIYLNTKILVQIKAEQYYSPLSLLGKWFPVYSLSLKYCIH